MKRLLRREHWDVGDEVHWRPAKGEPLRPMGADDRAELQRRFEEHGRVGALDVA
jgi:hypothetical protein